MEIKKLFKALTLVDGVKSTKWVMVKLLVDEIAAGNVTIKKKMWCDKYKQENPKAYPLDLGNLITWSTYDNTCIELYFINNPQDETEHQINQLVCNAKIYDGDGFYGKRKALRFEATLWLSDTFIHTIEQLIEYELQQYLERAYQNHLEAERKLWIQNTKNEILNLW